MVTTRSQRVKMSDISALTLYANRETAHRRLPPVDQLTCRGKACRQFQPEVVQCVPIGTSDGVMPEWKCEADLPASLKFGSVSVSCEGWDGPEDPYVLRGSCGLTYDLVRVDKRFYADDQPAYRISQPDDEPLSWSAIVGILVALYVLYKIVQSLISPLTPRHPSSHPPGGSAGPGSGGPGPGFGGGPPPPPPYSKYPHPSSPSTSTATATGPGFWTGALAGAAGLAGLNYLRDSGSQRQTRRGLYEGDSYYAMPPRMGGRPRYRFDEDDYGNDRGIGSSSNGGSMRTSSGFGGTNNR